MDPCILYLNLECAEMRGFNDYLRGRFDIAIMVLNNYALPFPNFRNNVN